MSRDINPVLSLFSWPENSPLLNENHRGCGGFWVSQTILAFVLLFAAVSGSRQDVPPKKASAQAAAIRGAVTTVQDNTPSGVAGISVKLTGDPLHGTPRSADTDEHGAYEV